MPFGLGWQGQQLETFLRSELLSRRGQQALLWRRDYSSIEAYMSSVTPLRDAWSRILFGDVDSSRCTPMGRVETSQTVDGILIRQVSVDVWQGVVADALVVSNRDASTPMPVVLCVHGMRGSPEHAVGLLDPEGHYHEFGMQLAKRGYLVVAPKIISNIWARNHLHRLAMLAGTTLIGLEIKKVQALLDWTLEKPYANRDKVAMCGLSQGGLLTLYMTPIEPRIGVAVVSSYFNDRREKMIEYSDKYTTFLESREEDKFISGLLRSFGDSDLASLIVPRPLLIETGKHDGEIYWPSAVQEFDRARAHYRELGLEDRIHLDCHEGKHEIHSTKTLDVLDRWLGEGLW